MAVQEDRYDALDDEALLRHLSEQADKRREHLTIEQHSGQWIAESYQTDGLSSGRSVMLGAAGPTDARRRSAWRRNSRPIGGRRPPVLSLTNVSRRSALLGAPERAARRVSCNHRRAASRC
jgi:hypothetical protein